MDDTEAIADQLEAILTLVMADADAISPAPDRYFLIGDRTKDGHWILGFSFKTKIDLRSALESGVCYEIHTFVYNALARSEVLRTAKSYIVFDYGEAPESGADQRQLRDKFIRQLNALDREHESGEFVNCALCGHNVDGHLMMGRAESEDSAPSAGWMICDNKDCTCFRTWGLGESAVNA